MVRIALAIRILCGFVVALPHSALADTDIGTPRRAPTLQYRVVAEHPHDVASFTQGLAWREGRLFESVGGYGRSAVIETEVESGRARQRRALPADMFGEGLTFARERLIQVVWHSGIGFVYDLDLRELRRFRYTGQGWGIAWDGHRLILSDGSSALRVLDADTFAEIARIPVRDGDRPVGLLNELEFANGALYANVWHGDRVAVIDPASGTVRAWLELSALKTRFDKPAGWNPREHVLNGIAYDARSGRFYVTGKCWPKLFEIEIYDAGRALPQ